MKVRTTNNFNDIRVFLFMLFLGFGIYAFAAVENFNQLIAQTTADQNQTAREIKNDRKKENTYRPKQRTLESLKSRRKIYALEGSELILFNEESAQN